MVSMLGRPVAAFVAAVTLATGALVVTGPAAAAATTGEDTPEPTPLVVPGGVADEVPTDPEEAVTAGEGTAGSAESASASPDAGDAAGAPAATTASLPHSAAQEAPAATPLARATADTTGVPAGRTLTPMAGGVVTTSSTVIADKVIEGDVTFTGSSLTLRGVRATGHVIFRGDNIVVEDSEFGSLALSGAGNVRVSRVDVFGRSGQDGIHITSDSRRAHDIVIEDTWIHNPQVTATSHYDGLQVRGVDRLTLRRVSVELGAFAPQHNAALFLENANGGNRVVTVEDSWLLGGGYAFYSFASEVWIRGTTFGGGRWGHLFPGSQLPQIVQFVDNRDTAGTPLGLSTVSGASIRPVDPVDRARKTAFVEALYADFLGRAPNTAEVLNWVSRLDAGASRYEVATALSRTDQWIAAVVTRFYRDTLGREPDAAGLAFWIRLAREGRPIASIASDFYASDEYLTRIAGGRLDGWVDDLYRKLLFRAAEPAGRQHWLATMAAGTSRSEVAYAFYQADETTRVRVEVLYRALLGRGPDPSGLRTWPAVVREQGDLVLAAFLASSDEYYARAQTR